LMSRLFIQLALVAPPPSLKPMSLSVCDSWLVQDGSMWVWCHGWSSVFLLRTMVDIAAVRQFRGSSSVMPSTPKSAFISLAFTVIVLYLLLSHHLENTNL
jgi:hypothetical protein